MGPFRILQNKCGIFIMNISQLTRIFKPIMNDRSFEYNICNMIIRYHLLLQVQAAEAERRGVDSAKRSSIPSLIVVLERCRLCCTNCLLSTASQLCLER